MEGAGSNISDDNPLRYESQRLCTFANWPSHAKVSSSKIAKAGFFYTGCYLEARCLWCGTVLTTWEFGDQVMARHRLANPECIFVKNQSNNVPLAPSPMPPGLSVTPQISQVETLSQSADTSDIRRQDGTPEAPELATESADQSSQYLAFMGSETLSDSPESRADPIDPSSSSGFESGGEEVGSFLDFFFDEKMRLRTFRGWNAGVIRPSELAKEGFIYSGIRDCVRCVFCAGHIGSWEPNDRPVDVHREIYPNCRFVRGIPCGNIPLSDEERAALSDVFDAYLDEGIAEAARADSSPTDRLQTSFDAGMDDTGIRETSFNAITPKAPSVLTLKDASLRPGQDDDKIGVIKHSGPYRPKYAPYEARIRTFKEWPPALKQQPKELADAGFYYIGLSDQVKCFYCDGGLRNWQPEDDPWVEHSRWFSKCGFVRLVKGDEFIAKCIISRPPDAMPELPSVSHDRGQISDEDLQSMMISNEVREALSCGIDPSRIKMAIKKKWRETGSGFSASQHLIAAACRGQSEQEDRVMVENTMTPSPFENLSPQTVESMASMMSPSSEGPSKLGLSVAEEDTRLKSPTLPDKAPTAENERKDAEPSTTTEVSTDLEQENRRLKEERTCRICMDNEIGVVFLPCGHLICCFKCAPALSDCPLCRQSIQGTVKTYMS